jgi:formate-dependent phosphoribosylglycinamide formyltransferase (GAR transformylase)
MGVILSTGKNIDEAKSRAQEAKALLNVKLK